MIHVLNQTIKEMRITDSIRWPPLLKPPAYLPEDLVEELIAKKQSVRVLEDWCEPFPGYHLYYPSSRQHAPAFAVVLEALRFRG